MSFRDPDAPGVPSPYPPEPHPRWWRRQLGLLLGVAAGLIVCGLAFAVVYAISGPRLPPPAPTAQAICTDLEHQNYSDLYARLAPAPRDAGTEQQFVASQRALDRLRGPVTSCSFTLPSTRSGAATATLTITRDASTPTQADLVLRASNNGTWQIESYDTSAI
jgi:hypothetical protein